VLIQPVWILNIESSFILIGAPGGMPHALRIRSLRRLDTERVILTSVSNYLNLFVQF
jgi:hypothetical protein